MTSDGSGNSNTNLRDPNLAELSGDTNGIIGWIEWTSGDTDGDIRRISAYDAVDDLTPQGNFSTTPSNSATYLLHRYDPQVKRVAMSNAIRLSFPKLFVGIIDESLVVDNLLVNPDFESALDSGAHPSWTNGNSPTIALETTRVFHGASSNSITSHGSAGAGQTYQEPAINIQDVLGRQLIFKARVYDTTADQARIRMDWNGTDFANSEYHTGVDEWQLLYVQTTIPEDATRIRAICEVLVGTNQAYFDATWMAISPLSRLTLPASIVKGPYRVEMADSESNVSNSYHAVTQQNPPIMGRRLRVNGKNLLTAPMTDAATTEIGDDKVDLVVARAAEEFFRMAASRSSGEEAKEFLGQAQTWQNTRIVYERTHAMQDPPNARPDNIWKTEEDSSGRYLVFTDGR